MGQTPPDAGGLTLPHLVLYSASLLIAGLFATETLRKANQMSRNTARYSVHQNLRYQFKDEACCPEDSSCVASVLIWDSRRSVSAVALERFRRMNTSSRIVVPVLIYVYVDSGLAATIRGRWRIKIRLNKVCQISIFGSTKGPAVWWREPVIEKRLKSFLSHRDRPTDKQNHG